MDDSASPDRHTNVIVKDARCEVSIAEDKKVAYATLFPPANGGKQLDAEGLLSALQAAGIVFGIRVAAIQGLAESPRYNKRTIVAEALQPMPGTDSRLVWHFSPSKDKAPEVLEDGSVDYKNLGLLHNVRENDILCTKIPPTEGTPGKDVAGGEITPRRGKDLPLPLGKNVQVSEDGLHILATIDGYADILGKKACVLDIYHVKGDVDYRTGNIDFVGNVHIHGDVLPGFVVKAEGNVVIDGCVDGGTVSAGGNIFIKQGVMGASKGQIQSGGELRCKYLQNALAEVEDYCEAESCVNSTISCGGNVRFVGSKSSIIASHITVRHQVNCINIGSKSVSMPSVLEVGADPYLVKRSAAIPKEMEEIRKNLVRMDTLVDLFQKLYELGRLSQDKYNTLLRLKAAIETQRAELAGLVMEQGDVKQRMLSVGYGVINAKGTVYAGTLIIMGEEKMKLDTDFKYTKFYRTQEGICTSSADQS